MLMDIWAIVAYGGVNYVIGFLIAMWLGRLDKNVAVRTANDASFSRGLKQGQESGVSLGKLEAETWMRAQADEHAAGVVVGRKQAAAEISAAVEAVAAGKRLNPVQLHDGGRRQNLTSTPGRPEEVEWKPPVRHIAIGTPPTGTEGNREG